MAFKKTEREMKNRLERYRVAEQKMRNMYANGQEKEAKKMQRRLNEILDGIDSLEEYQRCVLYHRFIIGLSPKVIPLYTGRCLAVCRRLEQQGIRELAKRMHK